MLKKARTAGLVPALVVSIVIGISLLAPASARFNALAPSCGYGYGYPAPAPTVVYVSPNFGPTTGGTTVTITGSGFCGTITAVNFGANAATGITTINDTTATAVSPAGAAGQVDVTVTTSKGTSATGPGDKFNYVAPTPLKQCSTNQYSLTGSDGSTWLTIDVTNLTISVTPTVDSYLIITGNADLWTMNAGYNQDLGITVAGGTTPAYPTVSGQPESWKESGGFAGTFSPNAAAVQTVVTAKAGMNYVASLQAKTNVPDAGTIFIGAGPIAGKYSQTCIIGQLIPVAGTTVQTAASTSQYTLTGSDGATWKDIDATNLSVTFTAPSAGVLLIGGNADLWTANGGYNQDLAINVNGAVSSWKESGGFAGTFSPNAAFVQTVIPAASGTAYTAKLQWKTNISDAGTIYAGAGPVAGKYSPTRITMTFVPTAGAPLDKASTSQYTLMGSDGAKWAAVDPTKLTMAYVPTKDCTAIISGNVDLWTANAGFNQDIGISVVDTTFPTTAGQPEGWKESGGFAGTFSPNAAYLQIVVSLKANTPYSIQLLWKANIAAPSTATIYAGAGPIGGAYSPTRLTLQPIGC
jgi:hypothetical protein